jgi:OOP family OmpA-OmpF porin
MSQQKRNTMVLGGMVGAIAGGAIGAGVGPEVGDSDDDRAAGLAIGIAAGALLGGLVGYLIAEEEAPPPPPPPPPPAPPRAAPPPPPPPAEPRRIVLRGINFDFDRSNIKAEFRPVLDEGAQILKDNPTVKVTITGYTDAIGTEAYNQRLSERRARAVRQYLIAQGIAAERLEAVGRGESDPVAPNTLPDGRDNPEGRAMNRRAELRVQ